MTSRRTLCFPLLFGTATLVGACSSTDGSSVQGTGIRQTQSNDEARTDGGAASLPGAAPEPAAVEASPTASPAGPSVEAPPTLAPRPAEDREPSAPPLDEPETAAGGSDDAGNSGVHEGDAGEPNTTPPETRPSDTAPPDPTPPDAGLPAPARETCWFEFLGDWVRCEESWSSGEPAAGNAASACAELCLADPACTTFYDHSYLGVGLPCRLHQGACTPMAGVGHEEDAGREYRKVCGDEPPAGAIVAFSDAPGVQTSPDSSCRFEYLPDYFECENSDALQAELTRNSFSECLLACEATPDCTAVVDWWYEGPTTFECALHLSTCDEPVSSDQYGQRTFQKVCDRGP